VTITGVDDTDEDGDMSYSVILGAASSDDLNYHGINPDDVAIINIDDEIPLSITCPQDQVGSVGANCDFVMPDFTGMAVVEGGEGAVVVTQSPLPGTIITANTTFSLTATDELETSVFCSANLTLIDEILPLVTCPGNQNLNADANCEATLPDYTNLVSATDNCDQTLTIIQNPAPGSIITATTTVTISATDDSNNTGSCEFTVILNDVTAPLINCPGNQTIEADASCDAVLTDFRSLAVVTDNCNDTPTVTQEPAPGTIISGITTVVLTATDEAGNSPSCSFQVSVTDDELPTITCPEIITIGTDPYMCSATISDLGTPVASDNCGVAFVGHNAPPIFSTGQTTVTWTVTDINGNSNTCEQTVTVVDDEAPLIDCYDNETVYVPNSYSSIDYPFNENFFDDNCGVTDFVWTMSGATTRSSPSSGINPLGEQSLNVGPTTIQIAVRDGAGNGTVCSFTIIVQRVDDPTVICPGDNYLGCNPSDFPDNTSEMNYYMETGWILHSVTSVLGSEMAVAGPGCFYERTRTYTVTFRHYWWIFLLVTKVTTCTRTYTYKKDTGAPTLTGVPANVTVEYNNVPTAPTVTVSDNCDAGPSLTYSQTSTQNPDVNHSGHYNYTITRTWEAVDDCENTTASSQVITVQDTQAPQITCPNNIEEAAGSGLCSRQLTVPDPLVSDNGKLQSLAWTMSGATEGSSPITGINYLGQQLFNPGETSVTYTATDVSGRTNICSFTITIADEEKPVVNCPPPATFDCVKDLPHADDPENFSYADFVVLGGDATDNCSTTDELSFSYEDVTDPTSGCKVTRTYTVTDAANNVATCTQVFTITDTTPPQITCDDIETGTNDGCAATFTVPAPTVTDACSFGDVEPAFSYRLGNDAGNPEQTGEGDITASFPLGTTTIYWTFTDECGNSSPCEQDIIVVFPLSAISYDDGSSSTTIGSGVKPMLTSTHTYFVDNKTTDSGYDYQWAVYSDANGNGLIDGSDAQVSASLYELDNTTNPYNPAFVSITFLDGLGTANYIISIIKTKNPGLCTKQELLPLTTQANTFDVALLPFGDHCQAGETGTPNVIFWEIRFPEVVTEPFQFEYNITLNGSPICSGTVSGISYSSAPVTHVSGCPFVDPATLPYAQVTKSAGSRTVMLEYTISSTTGIDQQIGLSIDATDVYEVSDPNISNNTETLDAWGIPNTSEIATD
jgi:hypothetical protein